MKMSLFYVFVVAGGAFGGAAIMLCILDTRKLVFILVCVPMVILGLGKNKHARRIAKWLRPARSETDIADALMKNRTNM